MVLDIGWADINHARVTIVSLQLLEDKHMKVQILLLGVLLLSLNTAIAQWDDLPPPPPEGNIPSPSPQEIGPADSNIFDNVSRGYEHFEPIHESHAAFGAELDNDGGEVDVIRSNEIQQDMIDAAENPYDIPDRDE